jgi:hypothetical protein
MRKIDELDDQQQLLNLDGDNAEDDDAEDDGVDPAAFTNLKLEESKKNAATRRKNQNP